MPDQTGFRDISPFGPIDRVEVSHAFTVFGILTVCDIDPVLVNHRCCNHLVACSGPHRVLRIRIEFPKLLARRRFVTAHPAITLRGYNLNDASDGADARRGPLPMENPILNG